MELFFFWEFNRWNFCHCKNVYNFITHFIDFSMNYPPTLLAGLSPWWHTIWIVCHSTRFINIMMFDLCRWDPR